MSPQELMPLTFTWLQQEIDDRKYLVEQFNDEMVRSIYKGQINALEAVKQVLIDELQSKNSFGCLPNGDYVTTLGE
jgi:hypothetical protein